MDSKRLKKFIAKGVLIITPEKIVGGKAIPPCIEASPDIKEKLYNRLKTLVVVYNMFYREIALIEKEKDLPDNDDTPLAFYKYKLDEVWKEIDLQVYHDYLEPFSWEDYILNSAFDLEDYIKFHEGNLSDTKLLHNPIIAKWIAHDRNYKLIEYLDEKITVLLSKTKTFTTFKASLSLDGLKNIYIGLMKNKLIAFDTEFELIQAVFTGVSFDQLEEKIN